MSDHPAADLVETAKRLCEQPEDHYPCKFRDELVPALVQEIERLMAHTDELIGSVGSAHGAAHGWRENATLTKYALERELAIRVKLRAWLLGEFMEARGMLKMCDDEDAHDWKHRANFCEGALAYLDTLEAEAQP